MSRELIRTPAEELLLARLDGHISPLAETLAGLIRARGLPSRRVEAYKYADLRALPVTVWEQLSLAEGAADAAQPAAHDIDGLLAALTGGLAPARTIDGAHLETIALGGTALPHFGAEEIHLAPGARLTRIVTLAAADDSVVWHRTRVHLSVGASFQQFVLGHSGLLHRLETEVHVMGAGARAESFAVYLGQGKGHLNLATRMLHLVPDTSSVQMVKGVVRDKARVAVEGKVVVARDAQRTDSRQDHHALLLNPGARVDSKPELEIYADDVVCGHGNTAGALDEAQVFYARARGMPEKTARDLLTLAFLGAAIPDYVPDSNAVLEALATQLRAGGGS